MVMSNATQETVVNAMSYINFFLIIMLFREIFFHFIPTMRGDPTVTTKAREDLELKRERTKIKQLIDVRGGEEIEKKETQLEVRDVLHLKQLLGAVILDLRKHGTAEVQSLIVHLSEIRKTLKHLSDLEQAEVKNYRQHLQYMPKHQEFWKDLKDEEKLTALLARMITMSETALSNNPNEAESHLRACIKILNQFMEKEREKMRLAA